MSRALRAVGSASLLRQLLKVYDREAPRRGVAITRIRGHAEVKFYPSSFEKGVRNESASKLAVAEMYVPGVSTRNVAKIAQELRGTDVSYT